MLFFVPSSLEHNIKRLKQNIKQFATGFSARILNGGLLRHLGGSRLTKSTHRSRKCARAQKTACLEICLVSLLPPSAPKSPIANVYVHGQGNGKHSIESSKTFKKKPVPILLLFLTRAKPGWSVYSLIWAYLGAVGWDTISKQIKNYPENRLP